MFLEWYDDTSIKIAKVVKKLLTFYSKFIFLSMQDKTLMILELSNVRVQALTSSNFEYMQKMQNAFHKKRVLPSKYIG